MVAGSFFRFFVVIPKFFLKNFAIYCIVLKIGILMIETIMQAPFIAFSPSRKKN